MFSHRSHRILGNDCGLTQLLTSKSCRLTFRLPIVKKAMSELPCAFVSKRVSVQSLLYENEFDIQW